MAANALLATRAERVTHIVFMGMGEPLANYAGLVTVAPDPHRRPAGARLLAPAHHGVDGGAGRAASIDSAARTSRSTWPSRSTRTSDDVRDRLMPVNKAFDRRGADGRRARGIPLPRASACSSSTCCSTTSTTAPEDAQRLVRLLRGVKGKVNLIPFNDWEGSSFSPAAAGAHPRLPGDPARRRASPRPSGGARARTSAPPAVSSKEPCGRMTPAPDHRRSPRSGAA